MTNDYIRDCNRIDSFRMGAVQSSSTVFFTSVPAAAVGALRFGFAERSRPLFRIGIAGCLELDPQWSPFELKALPEHIFEVTLIGLRYPIQTVSMDHNQWRVGAPLMRIAQFGPGNAGAWRRLLLYRGQQRAGKPGGGQARHRSSKSGIDRG